MIFAKNRTTQASENQAVESSSENRWMIIPMLILVGMVILLGVYIPRPIQEMILRIVDILQGVK
ncbi:hypothetical protein [Tepidibacillus marianensis]|uniref:hypothetical protein n=1 Tax=Tepidibacillus marianensis TaxID=3131995 RepID=UPI0030D0D1F1